MSPEFYEIQARERMVQLHRSARPKRRRSDDTDDLARWRHSKPRTVSWLRQPRPA